MPRKKHNSKHRRDPLPHSLYDQKKVSAILAKRREEEEYWQSVESSEGMTRAVEAINNEKIAFISNISFGATPFDLVQFLGSIVDNHESILRCQFITDKSRRFRGCAFVTIHAGYFVKLLRPEPFNFQGRLLRISEANQPPRQRKDLQTCLVVIDDVMIGNAKSLESEIMLRWQEPCQEAFLEINGRGVRQIGIQFSPDKRIEFPFKNITEDGIRLFVGPERKRVVRMMLRRPPFCFRSIKQEASSFESLINTILFGSMVNDLVWDASEGPNANKCWERTKDLSGGSSFGHFLVYDLILSSEIGSDNDKQLLHCLRDYKLCRYDIAPLSTPNQTELGLCGPQDWTGGYDSLFLDIPFETCYLVQALVSANIICFCTKTEAFKLSAALSLCTQSHAEEILSSAFYEYPRSLGETLDSILTSLSHLPPEVLLDADGSRNILSIRRVLVTPLRICPQPPELEASNRILRENLAHKDRFLRVTFVEENFSSILSIRSEDIFEKRIRPILRQGLFVAGRRFVFLAYSNSQLREQSCWFYDEDKRPGQTTVVPSAEDIRRSMGDLSGITLVGKHAARLGQGFSTTTGCSRLGPEQVKVIGDVKCDGFCFSDGIGLISHIASSEVSRNFGFADSKCPSAFQIRYNGCKGVVCQWPEEYMRGKRLLLRESMVKFKGNDQHRELEICSFSKPLACYLNRQIITLLSTLGIHDSSFLRILAVVLARLENALKSSEDAKLLLEDYYPKSDALQMIIAGFDVKYDKYLRDIVKAVRNRQTLDLTKRARMLVSEGILLLGVLDETKQLSCNQIYFRSTVRETPPPGTRIIVGRNPCLHPGDVRILEMSQNFHSLSHLEDVLVFSQNGDRPQTDQMSGGDLDGDLYFAIWDQTLIPETAFPPMDYRIPKTDTEVSEEAVTSNKISDFFLDYMKNDNLGMICNAHVVYADLSPIGARCEQCVKLAELASIAVDFNKTGVPAVVSKDLVCKTYPDFMENSTKPSYQSSKVLGQIYRQAKGIQGLDSTCGFSGLGNGFDKDLLFPGHEDYLEEAKQLLGEYNSELYSVACKFEVWDEAELVSGFITKISRKINRNKSNMHDGAEFVHQLVKEIQERYKQLFWDGLDFVAENPEEKEWHSLLKASAWYSVTYGQPIYESDCMPPYLSFAWLAIKPMCQLKLVSLAKSSSKK